jgi:predicted RNA-binding protein with PUA-like domain
MLEMTVNGKTDRVKQMKYWLMKSEPETFGIDDLQKRPGKTEPWDGVRNYQARNMMRDEMSVGDMAFFYHSNCEVPGIVGTMTIVKAGYPDATMYNPDSKYYDPKATPDNPRWFRVDVKFRKKFKNPVSLHELKQHKELSNMPVLMKGSRLSITPVTEAQWNFIVGLAG